MVGTYQFYDADAHLIDSVVKAKPAGAKGHYVQKISISSTMGPGVKIDETHVEAASAKK